MIYSESSAHCFHFCILYLGLFSSSSLGNYQPPSTFSSPHLSLSPLPPTSHLSDLLSLKASAPPYHSHSGVHVTRLLSFILLIFAGFSYYGGGPSLSDPLFSMLLLDFFFLSLVIYLRPSSLYSQSIIFLLSWRLRCFSFLSLFFFFYYLLPCLLLPMCICILTIQTWNSLGCVACSALNKTCGVHVFPSVHLQ